MLRTSAKVLVTTSLSSASVPGETGFLRREHTENVLNSLKNPHPKGPLARLVFFSLIIWTSLFSVFLVFLGEGLDPPLKALNLCLLRRFPREAPGLHRRQRHWALGICRLRRRSPLNLDRRGGGHPTALGMVRFPLGVFFLRAILYPCEKTRERCGSVCFRFSCSIFFVLFIFLGGRFVAYKKNLNHLKPFL